VRAAEREENDPPRQRAEQAESDGSIKLKSAPCDPFRAPFPLFDLKRSQRDRISSPVVVRQQQSMSTLIRHGPRLDVPTRVNPRPAHKARPCCPWPSPFAFGHLARAAARRAAITSRAQRCLRPRESGDADRFIGKKGDDSGRARCGRRRDNAGRVTGVGPAAGAATPASQPGFLTAHCVGGGDASADLGDDCCRPP